MANAGQMGCCSRSFVMQLVIKGGFLSHGIQGGVVLGGVGRVIGWRTAWQIVHADHIGVWGECGYPSAMSHPDNLGYHYKSYVQK